MQRLPGLFLSVFLCLGLLAAGIPQAGAAEKQSFSDVPPQHFAYEAVEYLKERQILSGYSDGTFRPGAKVNRAEALKIIVNQLLSDDQAAKYKTSSFTDVTADAWYLRYVEWALVKGIIQGPPKVTAFNPSKSVTKAEFLKMFLMSRGVDPKSFDDILLPFSRDVADPKEWYYPYLRYAIAASMTTASTDGSYAPQRQITRSDVALFLHRYLLYRMGQQTQVLLSETEKELTKTIDTLAARNVTGAGYTSARALTMMRGAREIRPDEPMVKAVLKITEGYRSLVRAFQASQKDDWKTVEKLSTDAWFLGDQAKKITSSANALGNQLEQYAKSFADQARTSQ